ncbi:MAG TPA: hypothetical protein VE089_02885 [Nitrososphaeraceae archaeon]|nr:hypothetical protein [Nitrososphaeraceae archaeon]
MQRFDGVEEKALLVELDSSFFIIIIIIWCRQPILIESYRVAKGEITRNSIVRRVINTFISISKETGYN